MEQARRKHGARAACFEDVGEMLQRSGAAARNHWNGYRVAHPSRESAIVSGLFAVSIHAGPENLARAQRVRLAGPRHGVELGAMPAAMGVDAPGLSIGLTLRIN